MTEPANITDLRDTFAKGLPCAGLWQVDGHGLDWQVSQIKAGHRLLPTVRLPLIDADEQRANKPQVVARLDAMATSLGYVSGNKLPLCLRSNNVTSTFTDPQRWRLPLALESIPKSPLVWKQIGGALDQIPICDSWAPPDLWREEGKRWATSAYVLHLQELCSEPSQVMFLDNHEGAEEEAGTYKNLADIRTASIRYADFLLKNPGYDKSQLYLDIAGRFRDLYHALWEGFSGAFIAPAWRDRPFLTACYRGLLDDNPGLGVAGRDRFGSWNPSSLGFDTASPGDGASPGNYTKGLYANLTSALHTEAWNQIPEWEARRQLNPRSWREMSVGLQTAVGPQGEITPDIWQGLMASKLWAFHEPGEAVLLRYWARAATLPTEKLGRFTVGDYVLATAKACDEICDNPVIREFWLHGTPVVTPGPVPWDARQRKVKGMAPYPTEGCRRWLDVSCNDPVSAIQWSIDQKTYVVPDGAKWKPAQFRVWAVANEFDGRWLVWAFTPVAGIGTVTATIPGAGDVTIDMGQVPGGDYWIVEPAGIRARRLQP